MQRFTFPLIRKPLSVALILAVSAMIVVNGTVAAQQDDRQLFVNIFNETAQTMGWSVRITPDQVVDRFFFLDGDSFRLEYNVSEGEGEGMGICEYGNAGHFADVWIRRYPTIEEAQYAAEDTCSTYLEPCESILFHNMTAYLRDHELQRLLSWAMGDIFFMVSDEFSCESDKSTADAMPLAEALYAAAINNGVSNIPRPGPNPEPNPDPYIEPGPYIDPNPEPYPYPDPDPVPGPITIDQETLEMLQSILSTPALPITGAIAGGLVAWVISMLGGNRTVPPTAPRPPKAGFRPGQVGPDGKVWSPGQGWVSKSTIDYQQKWLQKGWRLNPQTNKLEVQPGAINEKGEVWYKVPHEMDEGDSHYWVDKVKVQEIERNLAEGKIWDRSLDWQTPEDSNRYQSDRDGRRQREREASADKNAEIQKAVQDASQKRKEEYQDWLKKYEYKEQMPAKLTKLEDDLDAIDQDLIKKNVYVLNKWQHDKTLVVHGLTIVNNLVYDHTLGQLTGSQGFTCGDYVEKTEAEVKAAVDKQFPGAKVQRVHFDEKSTNDPTGLWNQLDSKVKDNHVLLKVTIPDGPELSVDFHGRNAKIVGEAPKIMRPFSESEQEWKKWLGEDEFVETVDP